MYKNGGIAVIMGLGRRVVRISQLVASIMIQARERSKKYQRIHQWTQIRAATCTGDQCNTIFLIFFHPSRHNEPMDRSGQFGG